MKRDMYEYEDPYSCHDSLQAVITEESVSVTIDEPWAGDTETGFGREASLTLPRDEAIKMAERILEFYNIR